MTFPLHPQIVADTLSLGDLGLSRLLLIEEIALCSGALKRATAAAKLNIGALGNRVSQLHIHIVARFETDETWPDTVWGRGTRIPYAEQAARQRATTILTAVGIRRDADPFRLLPRLP